MNEELTLKAERIAQIASKMLKEKPVSDQDRVQALADLADLILDDPQRSEILTQIHEKFHQ